VRERISATRQGRNFSPGAFFFLGCSHADSLGGDPCSRNARSDPQAERSGDVHERECPVYWM